MNTLQPSKANGGMDCRVAGCLRPVKYILPQMCNSHYQTQWKGHKITETIYDPRPALVVGDVAFIPLGLDSKQGYTIVDKEFAYLADKHKWHKSGAYVITKTKRKNSDFLHHFIVGDPPEGYVVDHININTYDNRKRNLRFVTHTDNSHNINLKSNNTSGFRGVTYVPSTGKWRSQITYEHKHYKLGDHNTPEEAAVARREAEVKLGIEIVEGEKI